MTFRLRYNLVRAKDSLRNRIFIIYLVLLACLILLIYQLLNVKKSQTVLIVQHERDDCYESASSRYSQSFKVIAYSIGPNCQLGKLNKPNYTGRAETIPTSQLMKPFEEQMSKSERKLTLKLVKIFSTMLSNHGLSNCFYMSGGTLLGSYRHHGFIPWDDDLDLCLNLKCVERVLSILDNLKPTYNYVASSIKLKFFTKIGKGSKESRKLSSYSWGWPYLDIAYININETHVSEVGTTYGRKYAYPITNIFPLIYRPFENIWLPAPFNPFAYLVETYGQNDICTMFGYSHIKEGYGTSGSVACSSLARKYAFVRRNVIPNIDSITNTYAWVKEELILQSFFGYPSIIHTLFVPSAKQSASVKTYAMIQKPHN